jgi:hypothetical protein
MPMLECRTLAQCHAALRDNHAVCFNPVQLYGGKFEEAFHDFAEWVWRVQQKLPQAGPGRRKALFTFDEAGDMIPASWTEWKRHPARNLTNTGREWGIDICCAAQAPTDLPLKFRNQINHWFIGKRGDVGCLEPMMQHGFKWEDNQRLGVGQFKHFNKKNGAFADYRTRRES